MSPQANTSSQKMQGAMYLKEECEMSCRVKTEREMVGGVCVYVCVCARMCTRVHMCVCWGESCRIMKLKVGSSRMVKHLHKFKHFLRAVGNH